MQAQRKHRLGEPGIDHAGLKHGATLHRVDAEDAVQPGEGNEHRVRVGQRAAGEPGSGAPGHEGHLQQV